MDFNLLYEVLPKEPLKWDFSDVEVFLKFISLDIYFPKFKEQSIDGSVIKDLDKNDLEQILKIENPIAIKKLLQCFFQKSIIFLSFLQGFAALKSYESFVIEKKNEGSSPIVQKTINYQKSNKKKSTLVNSSELDVNNDEIGLCENIEKLKIQSSGICFLFITDNFLKKIVCFIPNTHANSNSPLFKEERKKSDTIYQKPKQEDVKMSPENTPENTYSSGEIELVLQPVEGSQTNFYRFDSKGGKIGRHSTNEMVILEESISRHHAEVFFTDGAFYLKDTGSTTGTFIKIAEIVLKEKMILEMGSNQFFIEKISEKNNTIDILILEGFDKNARKTLNFNNNSIVSFGRKNTNTIILPNDNHMSNSHARIQKDNRNFFVLEDLNSTNGTWMRLSPEQQKSAPFLLKSNTIFKIGLSQSFLVKKIVLQNSQTTEIEKNKENDCVICYENEKNAIFLPCKHNSTCMKCATKLKICPICRGKIENFIQFFKT